MPEPRIILWDLETAPSRGWFFELYREGNIIEIDQPGYILSFAYKVLGERKITCHAVCDYPLFDERPNSDAALVQDLYKVLSSADITVAHNGDRFDLRTAYTSLLATGLPPPSPSKSVDTLKILRKHFKLPGGNRLDDVANYLGVGRKIPTTGKKLWLDCVNGDRASFTKMKQYNCQDVALLERVFLKVRPFITNYPNLNYFTRRNDCPVCQSKKLVADGWVYMRTGKRQRAKCLSCGHRFIAGNLIRD